VLKDVDLAKTFPANAVTIGYVHDFSHGNGVDVGLGGQFTLNVWPSGLDRYYGVGPGYAFEFFLRIRPSLHSHGGPEQGEHETMEK